MSERRKRPGDGGIDNAPGVNDLKGCRLAVEPGQVTGAWGSTAASPP